MYWIRKHRPSPGTAFGFAALIIALGGVAFAAIPDSNDTVHACYQKKSGDLRVVVSPSDCQPSEKSLDWNQRGPEGPPGPSGSKTHYAETNATECTSSPTEVALGPSVSVDVPPNSLMEVFIQAEGSVQPGDQAWIGITAPGDAHLTDTLLGFNPGNAGTTDFFTEPGGGAFGLSFNHPAPPGTRTYTLTYHSNADGRFGAPPRGPFCFRNRRLWISFFTPSQ